MHICIFASTLYYISKIKKTNMSIYAFVHVSCALVLGTVHLAGCAYHAFRYGTSDDALDELLSTAANVSLGIAITLQDSTLVS